MHIVVTSRTGSPDVKLREEIEAVDQALRQSFSGFDEDVIRPEIVRSFDQIGFAAEPAVLGDYARAISNRSDFEMAVD